MARYSQHHTIDAMRYSMGVDLGRPLEPELKWVACVRKDLPDGLDPRWSVHGYYDGNIRLGFVRQTAGDHTSETRLQYTHRICSSKAEAQAWVEAQICASEAEARAWVEAQTSTEKR
jgi:hypothetical protein